MIVSHLRRPDGNQGHEDGAQVRLGQLRGSHSIAQLSDICISMSVDQDEPNSDIRHLNILKNRYTGQTGPAGTLNYNRDTGRLIEDVLAQLTPARKRQKEKTKMRELLDDRPDWIDDEHTGMTLLDYEEQAMNILSMTAS